MNLFELFIKVGVDDEASGKIEKLSSKLGNGLKTAAKIGTAAVTAAAAGITALTTAAVKNYAEYEQLVGGVETLFKDSADRVQQYAADAYKTAGMSANDYMSTATSFAASLINSFKDTSSEVTEEMAQDMINALDNQVDAFEKATDQQIKLINKQYTENLKLIDKEEYKRLKAIDDEIAAIEAEEEAQEDAIKQRQIAEKKAELEEQVRRATSAAEEENAQKALNAYLLELEEDRLSAERKHQIELLKEEKNAVKEETDTRRDALKDRYDYELEQYKKARKNELSELKKSLKEQQKAIKASIGTVTEDVSLTAENYEAAAELVNVAMTDIADNASKFGQSIEYIRETYVSLSKSSYQVLDNLSLGYKATKEGVLDLISDAAKLDESVKENDLSFGNLVKALHVVQTEMGITGTTSLEAGRTISGSISSMKASWSNLMTGIADENADFGKLVDDFITTIVGDGTESNLGVFGNLLPRIEVALDGVMTLVEELFPKIAQRLPYLFESVLPSLVNSAMTIVEKLINEISNNSGTLSESIIGAITSILSHAAKNTPKLIGGVLDLVLALVKELGNNLDTIVPELIVSVTNIITELATRVPELTDAIFAVVDGIVNVLTSPEGILKMNVAGVDLAIGLVKGIINSIPRVVNGIYSVISNILEPFTKIEWSELGKNIVDGLLDGLKNAWKNLKKWFKDSFDDLVGGVKNLLGIHSPSRVFAGIGKNMALGVGEGWEDEFGDIQDDINSSLVFDDASLGVSTASGNAGMGLIGAANGTTFSGLTINVNGANVQNDEQLADMIALRLQRMANRQGAMYSVQY